MQRVILLTFLVVISIASASYAVVPYGLKAPDFTGVYERCTGTSTKSILEVRSDGTALEITCHKGSKQVIKTGTWDTTLVELVITWDGTPPGYQADVYVLLFRGSDLAVIDWTNKPYNIPEMTFRRVI